MMAQDVSKRAKYLYEVPVEWQHYALLCGVDEAGRGPLAGPVYAAAVILDGDRVIVGLADSKQLRELQRDVLATQIKAHSKAWAIAFASPLEIDQHNILRASLLAMRRAVLALGVTPQLVAVDGTHCPGWIFPSRRLLRAIAKWRRFPPHRFWRRQRVMRR